MIQVVRGDITRLPVDAIVNAANQGLLGGGGVDGAIHRAAGPQLLEACQSIRELRPGVRCPTGQARITPGYRLPARWVIHTAGPIWQGGGNDERELLASCYRNSIALAKEHGLKSIAFPAISCGIYGYPLEQAARIAVTTLLDGLKDPASPQEIHLVAFESDVHAALQEALPGRSSKGTILP
jgi:O-acetyl-ADP-ribose deacetylase (regulator of RNase III)